MDQFTDAWGWKPVPVIFTCVPGGPEGGFATSDGPNGAVTTKLVPRVSLLVPDAVTRYDHGTAPNGIVVVAAKTPAWLAVAVPLTSGVPIPMDQRTDSRAWKPLPVMVTCVPGGPVGGFTTSDAPPVTLRLDTKITWLLAPTALTR